MKNDKVSVKEQITTEAVIAPPDEVAHRLEGLRELAKKAGKNQQFVLASGKMDEGIGERVLTVAPDGSYSVEFVAAKS